VLSNGIESPAIVSTKGNQLAENINQEIELKNTIRKLRGTVPGNYICEATFLDGANG
jgi:hypothetical protein